MITIKVPEGKHCNKDVVCMFLRVTSDGYDEKYHCLLFKENDLYVKPTYDGNEVRKCDSCPEKED